MRPDGGPARAIPIGRQVISVISWAIRSIRDLLLQQTQLVQATRRNMPTTGPLKPRRTGRVVRPKEEWIAIEAAAIVDPETWELAQQQLRLNRERSPRNTKTHAYLLQSLLICSYCQVRMLGHTTGRPEKPNRRYLCGRKASLKGHPHPMPRTHLLSGYARRAGMDQREWPASEP